MHRTKFRDQANKMKHFKCMVPNIGSNLKIYTKKLVWLHGEVLCVLAASLLSYIIGLFFEVTLESIDTWCISLCWSHILVPKFGSGIKESIGCNVKSSFLFPQLILHPNFDTKLVLIVALTYMSWATKNTI